MQEERREGRTNERTNGINICYKNYESSKLLNVMKALNYMSVLCTLGVKGGCHSLTIYEGVRAGWQSRKLHTPGDARWYLITQLPLGEPRK